MPSSQSSINTLRQARHRITLYMGVTVGTVIFQATVASTPASPTKTLALSGATGSAAAVRSGMRVVVESSGGARKGVTSVRYSGTTTTGAINLRELSSAEISIVAGDVIKVYDRLMLTDKLVANDATFAPDGQPYTNQHGTVPPITISGGHFFGLVDDGQTYATVTTLGSPSYTVDEDSAATVTHAWTLPGGVAFAPGSISTDASPTLQANAGDHRILHVVTDSTNSATWTQEVYARVHDDANPPLQVIVEAMSLAPGGGSATVTLRDGTSESLVPDGALVGLFAIESPASMGNAHPGRSAVKLIGFMSRDENEGDGAGRSMTFEIASPLTRLQGLPGFSKVMTSLAAPTNFNEYEGLTVRRALIALAREYTNITEFFDLLFDGMTDYAYPAFYLQKQTSLEQMQELAAGVSARVTCDRTGRIAVQGLLDMSALADRAAITTTLTLTLDDVIRVRSGRDHFRTVETLECAGFIASATPAPIFSRYPGTPGRGTGSTRVERLIASSQSDLNARCGRAGAAADGVYIDAAGTVRQAVTLEVTLPGAYDVFDPAYREWVGVTLGATDNLRGSDWNNLRFQVERVEIAYEGGTATTTLSLKSETHAPPGATYIPPISTVPNDMIDDVLIPFTGGIEVGGGGGMIRYDGIDRLPAALWGISGGTSGTVIVMRTTALTEDGIGTTWLDCTPSGITGYGCWALSDPYKYQRKFILTSTGLWRCEDIRAGSPVATLVASNLTMFGNAGRIGDYMEMSVNRAGYILVKRGNSYAVTTNYGATWAVGQIGGGTPTWVGLGNLTLSQRNNPGVANQGYIYGTIDNGNSTSTVYRCTDWGLTNTWVSLAVIAGYWVTGTVHVPYTRTGGIANINDGSQVVYMANGSGHAVNGGAIQRSANAGISWANAYQILGGGGQHAPGSDWQSKRGISTFTHNEDFAIARTVMTGAGSSQARVIATNDRWATIDGPALVTAVGDMYQGNVNGFPLHKRFTLFFSQTQPSVYVGVGALSGLVNITPSAWASTGAAYVEADLSDFQ